MKTDLITSIGVAIGGALIAFFVCNMFLGSPEDVSIKEVTTTIDSSLVDPNPEVFNYKALNPTVEVYVGDCNEYGPNGECIDEPTNNNQGNP